MSEMIYRPLIEDMTWSYSRIKCFEDCPYRFYLKYISGCKEVPQFYASYGSFMHKLIEEFYKGIITKEEMLTKFLFGFQENVIGRRPQQSTVEKYIQLGIEYLKGFTPFPYNMVAVEKKVEFELGGKKFIGFIDYLGEKDGEYYIVDNKSRELKPRSGRKKPTVKDQELDEMLKQLYLYAAAVKQEYGKSPKALCFNCFKNQVFIEEPFSEKTFSKTVEWFLKTIDDIADENEFLPYLDFFGCNYICGVNGECCYYEMGV
jgi:hypothetical protein